MSNVAKRVEKIFTEPVQKGLNGFVLKADSEDDTVKLMTLSDEFKEREKKQILQRMEKQKEGATMKIEQDDIDRLASNSHVSNDQHMTCESQKDIAQAILDIILKYALTKDIDRCAAGYICEEEKLEGFGVIFKKIQQMVDLEKPLVFSCTGFPFKSTYAPHRVIGPLPDMAERKALLSFQAFLDEISQIYEPGAKIIFYASGFAFCDLLNVSEEEVIAYEDALKKLCYDTNGITICTISDLFKGKSFKELREMILSGLNQDDIISKEELDVWHKHLIRELESFPEHTFQDLELVNEKLKYRSLAFSKFLQPYKQNTILLSVHFSSDLSKKIGFKFSGGLLTPWHGVALQKDKNFIVVGKNEIDSQTLKFELINTVKCFYFE